MRALLLTSLAGLLFASAPASAHQYAGRHHAPHTHVYVRGPSPGVRVVIDPWGPGYRPAARSGYYWMDGHYNAYGRWIPGYWQPVAARAGFVWVVGHWNGPFYVDGYWRETGRPGAYWVDGAYDENGRWVEGYWAAGGPPPAPPQPPAPPAQPAAPEPPAAIPYDDDRGQGEPDTHHDYDEQ